MACWTQTWDSIYVPGSFIIPLINKSTSPICSRSLWPELSDPSENTVVLPSGFSRLFCSLGLGHLIPSFSKRWCRVNCLGFLSINTSIGITLCGGFGFGVTRYFEKIFPDVPRCSLHFCLLNCPQSGFRESLSLVIELQMIWWWSQLIPDFLQNWVCGWSYLSSIDSY